MNAVVLASIFAPVTYVKIISGRFQRRSRIASVILEFVPKFESEKNIRLFYKTGRKSDVL